VFRIAKTHQNFQELKVKIRVSVDCQINGRGEGNHNPHNRNWWLGRGPLSSGKENGWCGYTDLVKVLKVSGAKKGVTKGGRRRDSGDNGPNLSALADLAREGEEICM